jgi:hypothetical protein
MQSKERVGSGGGGGGGGCFRVNWCLLVMRVSDASPSLPDAILSTFFATPTGFANFISSFYSKTNK